MSAVVYTDGSVLRNPDGPGGWAAIAVFDGGPSKLARGRAPSTTNNRMELVAVIEGLRMLKRQPHVLVVSDSAYVVNPPSNGWLDRWQANGWRTRTGPVANRDLWERLLEQLSRHGAVRWHKVRGHSGHEMNERVDRLAGKQMRMAAHALERAAGGSRPIRAGAIRSAPAEASTAERAPSAARPVERAEAHEPPAAAMLPEASA